MKLNARRCRRCGKMLGVFAFVMKRDGVTVTGYWHPACFEKDKADG